MPTDWPPDWPPDALPVVLWPEDLLREALSGAPGVRLARVVAEAIDLDGNLDGGLVGGLDRNVDGGVPVAGGSGAAAGADALRCLSDDALGDLVAACGRLQSWAAGVQARVVAERAGRETHPLAHNSLVGQVTSELVVTEREATEVVIRAESGTQHPSVIAALVAGRIDTRKAHTLLRSASQLTVAQRAEAIDLFLPQAPRRTWKWLQVRMLAFAKNLHGAATTARAEAQRRSVQVDRAENDMGWLSAYLPATDAAAVWGVVDDLAHQLRHTAGEERTLGQLRADCLTGIVTGRLLPADRFTDTDTDTDTDTGTVTETDAGTGGQIPVCTCGGRSPVQRVVQEVVRPVRVTPTRPVVRVTIPASALLGLDHAPGHLDGFGPIPAETARSIATDATWQRLLTDPVTGILTDYSTTTYQPGKTLRTAVQARDETCTFPGCETPAIRCDLDHIEPFDHHRGQHSDEDGHDTRKLRTENRPHGTTVRSARETTSGPPGGSRNRDKNAGTDRRPGQTRAHNLQALCRRHHLLKTHAGWGIVRDPDTGITIWTTPTGRTHTRPPTVLDTHIDLDDIDPDTSTDLTLRGLTGQHLPRPYVTTEPGAIPTRPTSATDETSATDLTKQPDPDEPPF
jgi:hypothetical protein